MSAALKKEANKQTNNNTAQREIIAVLEDLVTVFYTDQAQQLFELGLSLKNTDLALSRIKLNEAFTLEPENLSIQIELLRMDLRAGDCSKALTQSQKLLETFFYSELLRLHNAQALMCQEKISEKNLENIFKQKGKELRKTSPLMLFWNEIEIERLYKKNNLMEAKILVENSNQLNPDFPNIYYWKYKISTEIAKKELAAKKYLNLCRKLTQKQIVQFAASPFLCKSISEVENYLKKNNTQ